MSLASRLTAALRTAARSPAVRRGVRDLGRAATRAVTRQRRGAGGGRRGRLHGTGPAPAPVSPDGEGAHALADRSSAAPLALVHAPRADGRPDPGEIVWGWVPFEEDLSRGKDRPVLVVAEEDAAVGGSDGAGPVLVALMLTSRDRTEPGTTATDEHGATWWTSAPAAGIGRAGPPRCGRTGCCAWHRRRCAVRAGGWTGPATIGSPRR